MLTACTGVGRAETDGACSLPPRSGARRLSHGAGGAACRPCRAAARWVPDGGQEGPPPPHPANPPNPAPRAGAAEIA